MDGVEITGDGDFKLVLIHCISNELKDHIRAHLSALCYGVPNTREDPGYYSFKRTVQEFLARFNTKPDSTKVGMIGELLTHVLASELFPELENISLYFNKEERSIKKGFDLTFYESAESTIWYAEVKSGAPGKMNVTAKSKQLMALASSDISEKLGRVDRQSLWDAAINDAQITLVGDDMASTVKALLRKDFTRLLSGVVIDQHVLLSASVFHPLDDELVDGLPIGIARAELESNGTFKRAKVIAIQKSTVMKIVSFFQEEAA